MQQLLWIETVLKLSGGLVLLVAPRLAIAMLGLPPGAGAFWPRLLGGMLAGMAAALYIEGAMPGSKGLGLAGVVVINLAAATVVAGQLAIRKVSPSGRGSIILWLLVALLFVLSLVEIAYV